MTPVVDIQQLTFTYEHESRSALHQVNLQVQPGEFITITGPSGCGKSTLAMCLAGFIPHAFPGVMEGVVLVQGKDTRDYPEGGLSGIVGLVQQDPEGQLCTLTVGDEIAFGPENLCVPPVEIRERVQVALESVGGLHLMDRQVHTLSGGEKQRVAIASVLAMKPALLVLDEPTANLDPQCSREVLQVLENLRRQRGMSVIIIEHRLEQVISLTDRLLVMEEGSIKKEWSSHDLDSLSANHSPWQKYTQKKANEDGGTILIKAPGSVTSVGKEKVNDPKPLLKVEGLMAGYGNRQVIQQVSFQVNPGETVAVMGANGSGKTTLVLTLLGILKTQEGTIWLNQEAVDKMKTAKRARHMGLVFQNPHHQLVENQVWKEAILPASLLLDQEEGEPGLHRRVEELLEDFHLFEYRDKNPFSLSLGEKKRLTVVSVLAYGPELLILDEPLVGQDYQRMNRLMASIRRHQEQGGATLMVCHEPSVVEAYCQRVLFLEEGRVLVDAAKEEAFDTLHQKGYDDYLPSRLRDNHHGEEGRKRR